MLPLTINITDTALIFKHLSESGHLHLVDELKLAYHVKGHYILRGEPKQLYKTLVKLSYVYDVELV